MNALKVRLIAAACLLLLGGSKNVKGQQLPQTSSTDHPWAHLTPMIAPNHNFAPLLQFRNGNYPVPKISPAIYPHGFFEDENARIEPESESEPPSNDDPRMMTDDNSPRFVYGPLTQFVHPSIHQYTSYNKEISDDTEKTPVPQAKIEEAREESPHNATLDKPQNHPFTAQRNPELTSNLRRLQPLPQPTNHDYIAYNKHFELTPSTSHNDTKNNAAQSQFHDSDISTISQIPYFRSQAHPSLMTPVLREEIPHHLNQYRRLQKISNKRHTHTSSHPHPVSNITAESVSVKTNQQQN